LRGKADQEAVDSRRELRIARRPCRWRIGDCAVAAGASVGMTLVIGVSVG